MANQYITGAMIKKLREEKNIVSYALQPHIEICGTDECVLDGIKGISKYSNDAITVCLGKFNVSFFGDNLYINSFSSEGAVLRGNIISMEFSSDD